MPRRFARSTSRIPSGRVARMLKTSGSRATRRTYCGGWGVISLPCHECKLVHDLGADLVWAEDAHPRAQLVDPGSKCLPVRHDIDKVDDTNRTSLGLRL